MKAHEIFQRMDPALAAKIFTFLHNENKPVYKAAIQGLANQRKLRAVFVERKPPPERHVWMTEALSRKVSDALAEHLLQAWLIGAHREMLCDFLDAFEIPHGEDGTAEKIPPAPEKEKIGAAVERLITKYGAADVAVYLHAFQGMDGSEQWEPLGEILRVDERLALGRCSQIS
jgi:hypothetical protein